MAVKKILGDEIIFENFNEIGTDINVSRTVPVSFVGANYALRAKHILHLLENGVDVHAYGPNWQWGHISNWRRNIPLYFYIKKGLNHA